MNVFQLPPVGLEPGTFDAPAALFFLEDGHYLFRYQDEAGRQSKFVTATDVAAAFSGQDQDSGWLAPGVVRCGYGPRGPWFVYTTPPKKVTVQVLNKKEGSAPQFCLHTVPLPRTVLAGVGSTYALWVLKSQGFDPQVVTYHAPFPNVYPDGRICWGQNTPPAAHHHVAEKVWNLFFQTPFNGDLAGGKSNAFPGDVRGQLTHLAARHAHRYPTSDLVPMGSYPPTLERLISQFLGV